MGGMMRGRDDGGDDNWKDYVLISALSAGLTAMATALATWGVDELRSRFGSGKEKDQES